MEKELSPRRARDARDAGLRSLQRLTGAAVAGALGLSAIFAGIAASSTHPRRAAQTTRTRTAVAARRATTPPLPAAHAPGMQTTPSPAPTATPTPPALTPAPATSPPAAVSGGS